MINCKKKQIHKERPKKAKKTKKMDSSTMKSTTVPSTIPSMLQNICKIKDLSPTSTSIHIYVKVLNVLVIAQRKYKDGTIIEVGEILVGDNTGNIIISARGKEQIEVLQSLNDIIQIENGKIEMFDGSYMRLTIDKWGSVSKCINTTSEIKSFVNILINKNSSMINNDDNENDTAGDDEYLKNYSMVEYTL